MPGTHWNPVAKAKAGTHWMPVAKVLRSAGSMRLVKVATRNLGHKPCHHGVLLVSEASDRTSGLQRLLRAFSLRGR